MSLVELTVVDLNNIWQDNQAKASTPKLQPKVFMIQITSKKEFGES
jgi:hypothetical protein